MTTQIEILQKFKVGDEVISPFGLMIIIQEDGKKKSFDLNEYEQMYLCAFFNKKGTAHRRIKPIRFPESELQPNATDL